MKNNLNELRDRLHLNANEKQDTCRSTYVYTIIHSYEITNMSTTFACLECRDWVTYLWTSSPRRMYEIIHTVPGEKMFESTITFAMCVSCMNKSGPVNPSGHLLDETDNYEDWLEEMIEKVSTFMNIREDEIHVTSNSPTSIPHGPIYMNMLDVMPKFMHALPRIYLKKWKPRNPYTEMDAQGLVDTHEIDNDFMHTLPESNPTSDFIAQEFKNRSEHKNMDA